MPSAPGHPCGFNGCPYVVPNGQQYCTFHRKVEQRVYDYERGTASERGYDANWRKLRAAILASHPFCEACKWGTATVVHHRDRDARNNEHENLMTVCRKCHEEIHKGERRR